MLELSNELLLNEDFEREAAKDYIYLHEDEWEEEIIEAEIEIVQEQEIIIEDDLY